MQSSTPCLGACAFTLPHPTQTFESLLPPVCIQPHPFGPCRTHQLHHNGCLRVVPGRAADFGYRRESSRRRCSNGRVADMGLRSIRIPRICWETSTSPTTAPLAALTICPSRTPRSFAASARTSSASARKQMSKPRVPVQPYGTRSNAHPLQAADSSLATQRPPRSCRAALQERRVCPPLQRALQVCQTQPPGFDWG